MHIVKGGPQEILLAVLIPCALVATYFFIMWVGNNFQAHKRSMREEFEKERGRIATLPWLDTSLLIQAPKLYMRFSNQPHQRIRRARSFNIRKHYLVVYDEHGDMWVGFIMPATLESLRAGEYSREDESVPICGRGERNAGDPVQIDGHLIDVYPIWMKQYADVTTWQAWAHLEALFRETFQEKRYMDVFTQILPLPVLREFKDKRTRYKQLCDSMAGNSVIG